MVFSEQELRSLLKRLDNTQASITGLSKWVLKHRDHIRQSVHGWLDAFLDARSQRDKVNLLYVANDVIQTARRDGPTVGETFSPALGDAIRAAMNGSDGRDKDFVARLKRMMGIWRERRVLSESNLSKLENAFTSMNDSVLPVSNDPSSSFSNLNPTDNDKPTSTSRSSPHALALAELDKQTIDDNFKGELADSDHEDASPAPDVTQITANSSTTTTGINQGLSASQVSLLEAVDVSEFEAITDETMAEKLDRISYSVRAFEEKEGIAKSESKEHKEADKNEGISQAEANDSSYETKLVSEKLTVHFANIAKILQQSRARISSGTERDTNLIEMLTLEMDVCAQAMTDVEETTTKCADLRQKVRSVARELNLENNRRKRARIESRRKELEQLEKEKLEAEAARRKKEEDEEAARRVAARAASADAGEQAAKSTSSLAAAFLNSVQQKPLSRGAGPPPASIASAKGMSLSVLDSLSKALKSGGLSRSPPPPLSPPPTSNMSLYGKVYDTFPPKGPPPTRPQRYLYPDDNCPGIGGPPPSTPPPPGSYENNFSSTSAYR